MEIRERERRVAEVEEDRKKESDRKILYEQITS